MVALAPNVILASGNLPAAALQQITDAVPIVFVNVVDPVGAGLVESLARPGGNTTGFTNFDYSISGKWLELLRQIKPSGCKLKAGSLSIDRMTIDTGRLSCGFDSGTASDGTLQMRMLCTDPEDKESLMYGAQLKLLPGKKIELILEPMDQK